MKLKFQAILSGKSLALIITRLNFQFSHRYAHKHTHAEYKMRPQHQTISQTGSVIEKQADKKEKDSYYVRQGLVTIQMCLYKDIFHLRMEIITLDQAVVRQTRGQRTGLMVAPLM